MEQVEPVVPAVPVEKVKKTRKMGTPKKMMPIELKHEIIKKFEQGARVSDLAKQYGRTTSTISTLLKHKETIKAFKPAEGITLISKLRTSVHEEMERLLIGWIREKQINGESLTQGVIREKALKLYNDLLKNSPSTSNEEASKDSFRASRGWFDNFKKRTGIHSIISHGDVTSQDVQAGEDYVRAFSELIKDKGYLPQQVFNCSETGLFWRRMPKKSYLTAEEKAMSGHKSMKDRLSLALCANASGDCKIKPLLVYHSENPRAFKSQKVSKEKLQVMWRANPNARITRQFFVEWVNLAFGPSVKKYLEENDLPMQALLVLDNAPAHPTDLEDQILEEFNFIKVHFLAPNTTAFLQPMYQQVISSFKKLYTKHLLRRCVEVTDSTSLTLREFWKDHFDIVVCLRIIPQAWLDVTQRTLTSAWKKLWPEAAAAERAVEECEPEVQVEREIVCLGNFLHLEIDESDVTDLAEEPPQELSSEDLRGLHPREHVQILDENVFEEPELEIISTSDIKDILGMWEKVSQFVERKHPEKDLTAHVTELFNVTCLTYFRNILEETNRQTTLNTLLLKRPRGENAVSVIKKAK